MYLNIYKSTGKEDKYVGGLNALLDNLFSLNIASPSDLCGKVRSYARLGIGSFKFESNLWGHLKQENIDQVIDIVGSYVESKDDFIKSCCVSENRKLKFPLGYKTSPILNRAVAEVGINEYYTSQGRDISTLFHIENNEYALIVSRSSSSELLIHEKIIAAIARYVYQNSDEIKDLNNLIDYKIHTILQNKDTVKLGKYLFGIQDKTIISLKDFKGQPLEIRYESLINNLAIYNGMLRNYSPITKFELYPTDFMTKNNILNQAIECEQEGINYFIFELVSQRLKEYGRYAI